MPAQPVRPGQPHRRTPGQVRPLPHAAAAALLALLAACGGGGGGGVDDAGAPLTAATITSTNYEGVARQTVNAANYMGDATGLVTGAQLAPGAQALFTFSRTQALRLGSVFAHNPALLTGATTSGSVACSGGGSIAARATDLNGNGEVDAGDSAVLTASNCVEDGATINGTLTVSFSAVTGSFTTNVYSATVSVAMQGLTASGAGGSATGTGTFTITVASNSATTRSIDLLAPSLTLSGNLGGTNDTITLQDYHLVTSSGVVGGRQRSTTSVSGGLSSTGVAGGLVTLSTVQPLVQFDSDLYASSGQLVATGAGGSRLRITVQSASTVLLELDANGDGSYETSTPRTWAELI